MKDISKALKDIEKELNAAQKDILLKWADKLDMDIDNLACQYAQYRFQSLKEAMEEEEVDEKKAKPTKVQEIKYKS